jgi:hypothetical protein
MNTEETFVLASLKEFVKLWGSGSQATFHLECSNGQAGFQLGAWLGPPAFPHLYPPKPTLVPQKRKKTPARIEKDLARAAEHRAKKETAAAPASPSPSSAAVSASPSQSSPAAAVGATSVSASSSQTPLSTSVPPADSATSTPPPSSAQASTVSAAPPSVTVTETAVEETQESSQEATERVYATAVIENSLVVNCDYMRANAAAVNINHQSTREFRSNLFTHTSSLELTVKTAALWDGPSQYIWKHLRQNDWKKKNGTCIKFFQNSCQVKFYHPLHIFWVEVYH